ncbi:hypothetical protein [Acidovorax sp.]|uniref:hypothetical protein n=1 Tax=Acidovorax sp. TaxID=1872122 RepID=UPI00391F6881
MGIFLIIGRAQCSCNAVDVFAFSFDFQGIICLGVAFYSHAMRHRKPEEWSGLAALAARLSGPGKWGW